MLKHITPIILTYNEAQNIRRTLEQLTWANDIVVVDSFSDDATLAILSEYAQVRVYQRRFDNFASQCNFGLRETGIKTEWVLNIDADYVLTPELVEEISVIKPPADLVGLRAAFIYCVYGRRLRSGIYPPVTVLFKKENAHFVEDGHAHRVVVQGRIENLIAPILHDDRKPLGRWLTTQSRYIKLEAEKLLSADRRKLPLSDRIRQLRVVMPPLILAYCLILRGGILDGWAGFNYAFQRAVAELMLSLYLIDHDLSGYKTFSFAKRKARLKILAKEHVNPSNRK